VLSHALRLQNEALVGLRSSAILHYDFRLPDSSAIATRLELGKSVCGLKFLDQSGAAGRSLIASGYTNQVRMDKDGMSLSDPSSCHAAGVIRSAIPEKGADTAVYGPRQRL
jgi:hypothetical protein